MRLSRFFINSDLQESQSLYLPPHLVNYVINVLRLKSGDEIILFNGQLHNQQSGEFSARLADVSRRKVSVQINKFISKNIESPVKLHLFQGISRSERMDYTIQKSVELGVNSITPVFTQRSNNRKLSSKQLDKKQQHWQRVADSACEQSGRTVRVPVNPAVKPSEIEAFKSELNILLLPDAQQSLNDLTHLQPASINIFIGPEGGLSSKEIETAVFYDYQGVRLGPRILRTETAGLSALSILQLLWGDLAS